MSFICALLVAISFTFAFAACSPGNADSGVGADYYLSLASDNWQVFNSKESIPDELLFKVAGENEYKLTVELEEGEQFTVNKVNSTERIGFGQLFTVAEELVSGENGSAKVARGGTFDIYYNAVDNALMYSYTAPAPLPVSGVQLDKNELSLEINATATLVATVQPENAENKSVTWSSSDDSVVAVTQDGAITAVSYGTATITATTVQNSYTATCASFILAHRRNQHAILSANHRGRGRHLRNQRRGRRCHCQRFESGAGCSQSRFG